MKKDPHIVSGTALVGEELALIPADIVIENGTIAAIEENPRAPPAWICPAFFNAHTHLGDTIAMDCGATGDLVALVTPPDGLKHRLLRAASRADLVAGMRASMEGMVAAGTAGCADFREGGAEGVTALQDAGKGLPFRTEIFGRDGGEKIAGGLGISSARDVPDLERTVAAARVAGKKIAFHAGERDAGDIDTALAFDPDFIVHATHATKEQLRRCADEQVPVVVCPRSNWTLGVTGSSRHPPVRVMEELGCTVWLGTDNVMFVPPDLFGEMAFLSTVYRTSPVATLRSAIAGSALAGEPFYIREGAPANLFVFRPEKNALNFSRDPVTSIIKRASFGLIGTNVFNSDIQ
ncbi:MAG: amidohydrolase family protein [Methanoregula sp.]|uniref:amidohydrolase family protein n=1 Tax=Methanoregula sp. TaxID=2052170 RepID=UPI0025FD89A7|nr:amidohydrolase family protein [Methanoregula sp.]MCK9631894.1 amidohydrolase family protein [Methanoregula sp.]